MYSFDNERNNKKNDERNDERDEIENNKEIKIMKKSKNIKHYINYQSNIKE